MNTKFTICSTSYTPIQNVTFTGRKVRLWERRDLRDGGWMLAGTFSTRRNATKLEVINAAPPSAALQEINEEIARREAGHNAGAAAMSQEMCGPSRLT